MEILINLEEPLKNEVIKLKDFIDEESINGISTTQIETSAAGPGEMGAGELLSKIKAIITAAEKPLTELVKTLQKYVDNYRTNVNIEVNGVKINISHGRSMDDEVIKELILKSIEKAS